ncbi:hypothetical protein DFP73DRAFT_530880 [Morchella snyderi]|nr:hypothetical protein DFP73DRAFT_530880 [Morchella snyderi]
MPSKVSTTGRRKTQGQVPRPPLVKPPVLIPSPDGSKAVAAGPPNCHHISKSWYFWLHYKGRLFRYPIERSQVVGGKNGAELPIVSLAALIHQPFRRVGVGPPPFQPLSPEGRFEFIYRLHQELEARLIRPETFLSHDMEWSEPLPLVSTDILPSRKAPSSIQITNICVKNGATGWFPTTTQLKDGSGSSQEIPAIQPSKGCSRCTCNTTPRFGPCGVDMYRCFKARMKRRLHFPNPITQMVLVHEARGCQPSGGQSSDTIGTFLVNVMRRNMPSGLSDFIESFRSTNTAIEIEEDDPELHATPVPLIDLAGKFFTNGSRTRHSPANSNAGQETPLSILSNTCLMYMKSPIVRDGYSTLETLSLALLPLDPAHQGEGTLKVFPDPGLAPSARDPSKQDILLGLSLDLRGKSESSMKGLTLRAIQSSSPFAFRLFGVQMPNLRRGL